MNKLKRIELHTDDELELAINKAMEHCSKNNINFYILLHGIDAYMQRRKRRDDLRHQQMIDDCSEEDDVWGNS